MHTVSVVVSGRVQGVGFRAYVIDLAEGLGVCGEVWNRRDGCVEVVAQHENVALLDDFIDRVWRGPGRVDDVACNPLTSSRQYKYFDVGPTR